MRFGGYGRGGQPAGMALCGLALLAGCASPGAPKPPSLQLPQTARDLSVTRRGDAVEVRFTVPSRTTDGAALRGPVDARLCRQLTPAGACEAVASQELREPATAAGALQPGQAVAWTDALPAALTAGPPRAMAYRLELRNAAGQAAGYADAAYVAAGSAPPAVEDLRGQGTRLGVLLQWAPVPGGGEVLLQRRQLDAAAAPRRASRQDHKAEPGIVMLQAEPGNGGVARTLDAGVTEGVPYRYRAERRVVAQVGARRLELFSAPSAAVELAWQDVYPPAAPAGLTGVGFAGPAGAYAVDLVWQPVDDPRVSGYVVRRVPLSPTGEPVGEPARLTPQPVTVPGFHDPAATAGTRYRYEVTAVDARGNVSPAAMVVVGG